MEIDMNINDILQVLRGMYKRNNKYGKFFMFFANECKLLRGVYISVYSVDRNDNVSGMSWRRAASAYAREFEGEAVGTVEKYFKRHDGSSVIPGTLLGYEVRAEKLIVDQE